MEEEAIIRLGIEFEELDDETKGEIMDGVMGVIAGETDEMPMLTHTGRSETEIERQRDGSDSVLAE